MDSILNLFKQLIPYLPTLIVIYAVVKLFSSGLNMVAKLISTVILCVLAYYAFIYLSGLIAPIV